MRSLMLTALGLLAAVATARAVTVQVDVRPLLNADVVVNDGTGTIASPDVGNTYYLVVPVSATEEGSYGLAEGAAGAISERPRAVIPCRATQDVNCN